VLLATGSEVQLCLGAAEQLAGEGVTARVVSMPSWERFAAQDQPYRDEVLPPAVRARVAVEAAAPFGWERWVGDAGTVIGMERFGASAPAAALFERFGFTPDRVADAARGVLDGLGRR
jgi:transketolase